MKQTLDAARGPWGELRLCPPGDGQHADQLAAPSTVVESFVDVVPESAAQLDDFSAVEGRALPALAQLPAGMRTIIVLRFYEDLSEAEIARLLGCSAGTVKSQTSRGLARLRAYFADQSSSATTHREVL